MAHLALKLVTPPIVEPVTLDQAKNFLRVDYPDDDSLITGLIVGARQYAEKYMHRAIFNQTWTRTLDNFPMCWNRESTFGPGRLREWPYWSSVWDQLRIDLPKAKTVSVTSITYLDSSTGQQITLDDSTYIVDVDRMPATIVPANGGYWPVEMLYNPGSVAITFVAGSWGDGVEVNDCPQTIVIAILMLISHWYVNRDAAGTNLAAIPFGVKSLLDTEKLTVFEYR